MTIRCTAHHGFRYCADEPDVAKGLLNRFNIAPRLRQAVVTVLLVILFVVLFVFL